MRFVPEARSRHLSHWLSPWRRAYFDAKKIRKMKRLRHAQTSTGYSLQQFDEQHCIFVHIPKCAGVAVCRSLFGNYGAGHHSILTYRKVFSTAEFDRYFKFTFVRNPWDRLVSAWFFLKAGGFHAGDRRWAEENLSRWSDFNSFVQHWLTREKARSWEHFRPQCDYICAEDGTPQVDFIGRYEHLEGDFARVCKQLGCRAVLAEENVRGLDRGDYRSYYTAESRQIVGDVYHEDIALLGYTFSPVPDRPEE